VPIQDKFHLGPRLFASHQLLGLRRTGRHAAAAAGAEFFPGAAYGRFTVAALGAAGSISFDCTKFHETVSVTFAEARIYPRLHSNI
jgi:hypothetical protein